MYRPARGGRSSEHFGGYKTINRIPLPFKQINIFYSEFGLNTWDEYTFQ